MLSGTRPSSRQKIRTLIDGALGGLASMVAAQSKPSTALFQRSLDFSITGENYVDIFRARPHSGFSLLFEALIMSMADQMPVAAIAELVGETDKRLWRIIKHYVEQDLGKQD